MSQLQLVPGDSFGVERVRTQIKCCTLIVQRNLRDAVDLAEVGDAHGSLVHRDVAALASLHAFELSRQLTAST